MNRIKELREAKGLQQKELALDLGVSQPTVSDWESGRKMPSAKSTMKMAGYFGVSVEFLLNQSEGLPLAFGERIVYLRHKKGLDQAELAASAGISPSVLDAIEKDLRAPAFGTVAEMANALGLSVSALMDGAVIRGEEEENALHTKAMELFQSLTEQQQQSALQYMLFLKNQTKAYFMEMRDTE